MEKEKIARINELARKRKAGGLTPEEQAEQDALRKHYSPGERSLSRAAGLAIIATRARRGARRPEGPEKRPEDRRTPNRKETDHERNEPGAQPERRRDGNG